jgi:hypothetical protein
VDALRAWIVGVAAASFAAGLATGMFLAPGNVAAGAPPAEQSYVDDLSARYGLRPAQQRQVRFVLQHQREREIAILLGAEGSQLPQPQMGEMLALRTATEQRIRALLDDEQRARYDRDSRPSGAPPGAGDRR